MHIVVATDGALDPGQTAKFVAPHAEGAAVTILTVIEIPRRLLADLRAVFGEQKGQAVDSDAEYVGISPGTPGVDLGYPGDDVIINQYLAAQKEKRTAAMVEALTAAGLKVEVELQEGENVAKVILDYLASTKADLAVMGATGQGLFEGLIGAIGTKVSRHAPCSVLLIRS